MAGGIRYEFRTELFEWAARREKWVFARLPLEVSQELRDAPHPPAGFGSIRVEATIGSSRFATSVFPESADGAFVLPVKAAVRRAEGIDTGDTVLVLLDTHLG